MRTKILSANSGATRMLVYVDTPTGPSGSNLLLGGAVAGRMVVSPAAVGSTPCQLTPAGQVAVLGAINTYLSGLSAAAQTAVLRSVTPNIVIEPRHVSYPVASQADADAQATALATIIANTTNTETF